MGQVTPCGDPGMSPRTPTTPYPPTKSSQHNVHGCCAVRISLEGRLEGKGSEGEG